MNKVRKQRLMVVLGVMAGLGIAVALALTALRDNINLFYTPEEIVSGDAPVGRKMRVGGLVVEDSVERNSETLEVTFDITDGDGTFTVHYQGILPDLFREGQGVVANGTLVSREEFEAKEVLAKHDEEYTPPEVQEALDEAGHPGPEKSGEEPGYGGSGQQDGKRTDQ
jgi:cytochrome c-type biogenesis protein CcmE